jgi:riboflavin kinase/FMN adenylyltransferase
MAQRSVITIGNFDGMHVGHRHLLAVARRRGAERQAQVLAMTFDPHPATVLRPGSQPPRLMSLDQKIHALHEAGADRVVVLEPTAQLLSLAPDVFVRKLVGEHHPVVVVEGESFRFGKNRTGDIQTLKELAGLHDFELVVVPPVSVGLCDQLLAPVSSSLVRSLISHGRVQDAARCLGQTYALNSRVVSGERRGRTLGVPTANLDAQALREHLLPAPGVYAGRVELLHDQVFAAAVSVGVKPSFDQHTLIIEAHLIDYDGDLYGHTITLRFARWLRDQQRFPDVAALQAQLRRDIDKTRHWYNLGLLDGALVAPAAAH